MPTGTADGSVTPVVRGAPVQAVSGRSEGVLVDADDARSRSSSSVAADDAADVLAAIGGRPLVVVVHDSADAASGVADGARGRADRLMALQVFTAVTGAAWESELVGALDRADHGVTVVRRCVDVSELLAAAATGTGQAALLSAELRRLDGDAVARLEAAGVAVVGLVEPGDERAAERLRQLGVPRVLPADAEPEAIARALREAVAGVAGRRARDVADPRAALPGPRRCRVEPAEQPAGRGRVVAVWGPTGAPGRTTVAVGHRRRGRPAGGARRCWWTPTSTAASSRRCSGCSTSRPGWPAPPGRPAPARWTAPRWSGWPGRCARTCGCSPAWRGPTAGPSCGRAPSPRCWRRRGGSPTLTVVDCAFSLEDDEELSFDTAAPRRNGATLAVLEEADTVLCVSGADPVALQRSIRALGELRDVLPGRRAGGGGQPGAPRPGAG